MKMLLWTALVLCFFSSIYSEKLHEHMTSDEITSIFNVYQDDVHNLNYEVIEILHANNPSLDHLHQHKPPMAKPQLRITAFSQDYTLYLEENNNVLLGNQTTIFLAENKSPNDQQPDIIYFKIQYPSPGNFKLYHDVEKRAAVSLEYENDDRFHVNGVIGDDIVIRSLPKRIHDEVLSQASSRSKRSSSSNDNGSRFGDAFKKTHHVFIKSNVTKILPYFRSLNRTNRKYDFNHQRASQKPLLSAMSEPDTQYNLTDKEVRRSKSLFASVEDIVYPQLLITIDYETYEIYNSNIEEVAKYMAAFWNAVDLRFREMSSPKVRLNIAGLIIPKHRSAVTYLDQHRIAPGVIKMDKTLMDMGKYFSTHSYEFPLNTYDVVVAITHKELGFFDRNGNLKHDTMGASSFKGACNGRYGAAVIIVKDLGGYNGITTAVHEVAHSLGAPHDGPETVTITGGPCGWEDGYLMSYARIDEKGQHFSKCSVQAMQDFLKLPQAECLRNKPSIGRPYPKLLPGRLISRDEQCRSTMGNDWVSYKKEENNCAVLWCSSTVGTVGMNYRPPAEGSSCAEKAICLNSQCVNDPELL